MAITNYTELQTALTNWLNRSDQTARYPEWIALAEADMRRQLRDSKQVFATTMTAGTASKALPSGIKSVESVRYNTSSMLHPLVQKSASGLAEVRRVGSGIPLYYALINGTLYFDVNPSDSYAIEIVAIATVTPLSGGSPTNSTLTSSPDIYLYGALLHASVYLEHDPRFPLVRDIYEDAVTKENIYRESQEFGAAPEQQLPVVFGGDDGT